jgi:hypothetical protein
MTSFRRMLWLSAFALTSIRAAATTKHDSNAVNEHVSILGRDAVPAEYVAKPYYPAPNGGWAAEWSDSYTKASAVVANMTLAEKVNLTVRKHTGSSLSKMKC